jgi:hypothetical protein
MSRAPLGVVVPMPTCADAFEEIKRNVKPKNKSIVFFINDEFIIFGKRKNN